MPVGETPGSHEHIRRVTEPSVSLGLQATGSSRCLGVRPGSLAGHVNGTVEARM